ncbi:MAG: homoserine dehydrogenase, partial [Clostridiales bacterium]|nr:homoserine dehydrogenase [Clostridiales bacterium]
MAEVALLGYGVVGSGVAELLHKNAGQIAQKAGQEISLRYILDIRDLSQTAHAGLQIRDFSLIENDPDVQVVAECIGGVGAALAFVQRALRAGKHVVTSNKELVAEHGAELLALAEARNLNFLFEASVGGGIPVLRPMAQCLAANRISEIVGILNGTTNFILS